MSDAATARLALALGDDALVLSHRLSEWCSRAPELEEDIALANIALDLLGQARVLLGRAGELEGRGRSEDDLAYLRDEREFTNVQLVELPNGDFATTIARQLLFSSYQAELYAWLTGAQDPVLRGLAEKAVKEVAYHREHATLWTLRLGDGTPESHDRMQRALDAVWPYGFELFGQPDVDVNLRAAWGAHVEPTLRQAGLAIPDSSWIPRGGRSGVHTEAFGFLLAEMQSLHRAHPGVTW